ncbi:MAG TPA: hypothetical protein VMJ12_11370 [Candidatus Acidoferrales bacterium]|nr:hypothetical protein [Candidatus Acidoferrales bacterium]
MISGINPSFLSAFTFLGIAAGMLFFMEAGRWLKNRLLSQDAEAAKSGIGAVEGAVFSLIALLIAFTFSGAASRFQERRETAVKEANAIGTVWLRLDLLPSAVQPSLREKLHQYITARVAFDQVLPNVTAAKAEFNKSSSLQKQIWTEAIADCRDSGSPSATSMLLPAMNDMFDLSTTRVMQALTHTPLLIYAILVFLVMGGSVLVGYGMGGSRRRNWFHSFAFVATITMALYLILDFEFPSVGLIRLAPFEQALVNLQLNLQP